MLSKHHLNELHQKGVVYIQVPDYRSDWVTLVSSLGHIMEQVGNGYIRTLKADKKLEKYSYSQSRNALHPHTEAPFMRQPPHYIALKAVRSARCGGGLTSFADGYAFIDSLPIQQFERLKKLRFHFPLMSSQNGQNMDRGIIAPLVQYGYDLPSILRLSYNLFRFGDYSDFNRKLISESEFAYSLAAAINGFFRQFSSSIYINDGELLILDNHRMMHSRTAFRDLSRHLEVAWIE